MPFLILSGNPLDALIADARALCQNESPQQARLDPAGIRVLRLRRSASPFYPSPFTHLANLGCAQFANQITGQPAGYLTAVRPLPPPSGDQLLRGGLGFHVQ